MSLQGQLQSALEGLAQAAQRLDAAAEKIVEKQKQTEGLREQCRELQSALDRAGQDLSLAQKNESDFEQLRTEKKN